MDIIINYLMIPQLQTAGAIIFLLALALLLGSSLLAFVSEIKHSSSPKSNLPTMSHNITRSTWLGVVLFSLLGGTTVFLPLYLTLMNSTPLLITGLSSSLALIFFLLYHFTAKIIKLKFIHAPLALFAAGCALGAAIFWYLPHTCAAWFAAKSHLSTTEDILFWWLGRNEVACFLHFILNAVGVAALFFLLANAREKENKRKQSREYYFQAAGYAGRWLLTSVTLQILPLGWIFYNLAVANPGMLFTTPKVYWFAGILSTALLGWLLLIKITKDGLVNRRATMIIALFFIISLNLFHFGPLRL
ncbi:MAG TPA: hypothetical protein EYP64_05125 [Desulfarculaceae bacterium]|nr:hypothetical protein [Desulfarculaceae bacterium]